MNVQIFSFSVFELPRPMTVFELPRQRSDKSQRQYSQVWDDVIYACRPDVEDHILLSGTLALRTLYILLCTLKKAIVYYLRACTCYFGKYNHQIIYIVVCSLWIIINFASVFESAPAISD